MKYKKQFEEWFRGAEFPTEKVQCGSHLDFYSLDCGRCLQQLYERQLIWAIEGFKAGYESGRGAKK